MWGQDRFTDHWTSRRIFAVALIGFFIARALIPSGFMPDVRALGEGRLELVICTSSGERVVHAVSLDGGANEPARSSLDDCPFHHELSKSIELPFALPVPAFYAAAAERSASAERSLTPSALGPPLGSRAPPGHLI